MAEIEPPEAAPEEPTAERTVVAGEAVVPDPPPKQRFVDRVWNFRAMVAVGLAALLLGGGLGAAVAAATGGDEHRRGDGHFKTDRWADGPRGPGGFGPGPGPRRQFRHDLQREYGDQRGPGPQVDPEAPSPSAPATPEATPSPG